MACSEEAFGTLDATCPDEYLGNLKRRVCSSHGRAPTSYSPEAGSTLPWMSGVLQFVSMTIRLLKFWEYSNLPGECLRRDIVENSSVKLPPSLIRRRTKMPLLRSSAINLYISTSLVKYIQHSEMAWSEPEWSRSLGSRVLRIAIWPSTDHGSLAGLGHYLGGNLVKDRPAAPTKKRGNGRSSVLPEPTNGRLFSLLRQNWDFLYSRTAHCAPDCKFGVAMYMMAMSCHVMRRERLL